MAIPDVASKLTEVDLLVESVGFANTCLSNCEIRGHPAQVIVVHELNADYTHAMGHSRSSKSRPFAACLGGQPLRRAEGRDCELQVMACPS